jgi:hypothetical protein
MNPEMREKRSNAREVIHQPISIEISEIALGRLQAVTKTGHAVDICSGGIGIVTDHFLTEGAVLKVRFPLADMKVDVPVFTEVMWLKGADGKMRAGLRFLD